MRSAMLDGIQVGGDDWVIGDDDGVLVLGPERRDEVLEAASRIQEVETAQADRMRAGESLRSQLAFADYRRRQIEDPTLTLRRHLAERGGAIEV
jgi:regulator of RNase E activity RraA